MKPDVDNLRLDRRLPQAVVASFLFLGLLCGQAFAQEPQPQDVAFIARADGTTQRYVVLWPPQFDDGQTHDLLLVFHGHGSDRWQYIRHDRDECRVARDVAAAQGMILVSPDYRARTSWMGPRAEADVIQLIAEVKAKHRIGKIVLCGGSMGGTASLTFAALHPELVAGAVSMNGTANLLEYEQFQDAIRESFGGAKAEIPAEYKRRSAEYWPERLTMPIGVTTGGKDTLVPPDSVLRLAAVLKKIGREVLVVHRPDGGHSTNYADGKAVLEFVLQRVKAASPSSAAAGEGPAKADGSVKK